MSKYISDDSNTFARFIVLEGVDGIGKSTQAARLRAALRRRNHPVYLTQEPTNGTIGRQIRRRLRTPQRTRATTLALLFAADRDEHLFAPKDGIVARLQRGEWVICDRYFFSSLVYQGAEYDEDEISRLNARFPLPRHVFHLSHVSHSATNPRRDPFANHFNLQRIDKRYTTILDRYAPRGVLVHRINASAPRTETTQEILKKLSL